MIRACAAAALLIPVLHAYSVLTHEAIVDSAWDANIKPLLLQRFPTATPDDLLEAHAYAYGGCIIQDMGYYPFGSKFFSDLLHYVRSGSFIVNQIAEATNLQEYAFALGSLAHYAADTQGHSIAVNPSVAIEYPRLDREYGNRVTYEDDPTAHIKVEFGFDVLQVARGNYASKSYHDFIGFKVSKPVLERAFHDTYGLQLKDVFTDLDLALGTYRHAVSSVIPEMTKVAWNVRKDDLIKAAPGVTRASFVYNLSRSSYEKEWDRKYEKPGPGARILGFFIRILPKVGPLKTAAFKAPTLQTVKMFENSFDRTLEVYRKLLSDVGRHQLQLADMNFDTGQAVRPAKYRLADNAYAKLVAKLVKHNDGPIDPKLRQNILGFYSDLELPFATKRHPKDWNKTLVAIRQLKSQTSASVTANR